MSSHSGLPVSTYYPHVLRDRSKCSRPVRKASSSNNQRTREVMQSRVWASSERPLLFLLEKAYWEWKIMSRSYWKRVNRECELGPYGMAAVRRFFYDAYSKCVNGSIFDGVKMDMVSFGMELLASNARDEHLTGARILRKIGNEHSVF
nr:uncharacterized protein LOC109169034 [Ipomoea batatas]